MNHPILSKQALLEFGATLAGLHFLFFIIAAWPSISFNFMRLMRSFLLSHQVIRDADLTHTPFFFIDEEHVLIIKVLFNVKCEDGKTHESCIAVLVCFLLTPEWDQNSSTEQGRLSVRRMYHGILYKIKNVSNLKPIATAWSETMCRWLSSSCMLMPPRIGILGIRPWNCNCPSHWSIIPWCQPRKKLRREITLLWPSLPPQRGLQARDRVAPSF